VHSLTMRPLLRVTMYLLTVMLLGCSNNSTITHSYVDPVLRKLDLQGVLVIGVAQQRSARIEFEDLFVKALARHKLHAVASHTLIENNKATADEVVAVATANGLDTIMLTRYMGSRSEEIYHPGTIYYGIAPAYGAGYYRSFPGYYGHAYEVAYQQPLWTSNTTHTLVSDLYVTASREHLWQAVSDTIQAGSSNKLRQDAIASLMGNLRDQGLLE
jgi:hypothetical protein